MMLTPLLGTPSRSAERTDVVDDLLACHGRIRHFVALAQRVCEAPPGTPLSAITEAAGAVARYFSLALPLHSTDEERSVRPRLEAAPVPRDVRQALHTMSAEHDVIHQIINEVLPLWNEVAGGAGLTRALRLELGVAAAELEVQFAKHLAPEEELLFPALRLYLPASALVELRDEMRDRRTPPH